MGGHSDKNLFHGTISSKLSTNQNVSAEGGSVSSAAEHTAPASTSSMRDELMGQATTDQVKNLISELYRPGAETGDGGTADAIREQIRAGNLVGGKDHIRKGRERLRQIEKLLAKSPNHPDKALLERLRDDLKDALGGA